MIFRESGKASLNTILHYMNCFDLFYYNYHQFNSGKAFNEKFGVYAHVITLSSEPVVRS